MPSPKEEITKSVYKEDAVPNAGTPYKAPVGLDPVLLGRPTTVVQREGYRTYWARESEVHMLSYEGYCVADPSDYPHKQALSFQFDNKEKSSCIRIPTRDSNEDLILLEIPLALYAAKKAEEDLINQERDSMLKRREHTDGHGSVVTTGGSIKVDNKK